MNSKMTTNSKLLTTEPKKQKQKQTKQTTRTGTESQKWRSHGGLSARRAWGQNGGKGAGNKQHKYSVQSREGEVKNSIGNVGAKELICTTHGHELKGGNAGEKGCAGWRAIKGGKWDNCNSIINKYIKKKKKKKNKRK